MICVPIEHCADCPFARDSEVRDEPWLCTVEEEPREIVVQAERGGPWLPPPAWCPLREADRLVTLRVS